MRERVTRHGNDVGELPTLQRAELILPAQQFGTPGRRRADGLAAREIHGAAGRLR